MRDNMGMLVLFLLIAGQAGWGAEPDMGAQWPDLRGPLGSFEALPCKTPLISDLKDMRRVWVSEEEVPGPAHQCHKPKENMMGNPIVAENKVFVLYFQPTGTEVCDKDVEMWNTRVMKEHKGQPYDPANPPDYIRIRATDYLLAIDVESGKTVWKTKLPRLGLNWINLNNGSRHQLVYGDGRIYAMGSSGALYAVDAKSGKVLWESDMGEAANAVLENCADLAKTNGLSPTIGGLKYATTPMAACVDGVIAFGFKSRKVAGTWALDAATGEHLWQRVDLLGASYASEWMAFAPADSKPMFIGVRSEKSKQAIAALEPRTGAVRWEVPVKDAIWLARKGNVIVANGGRGLAAVKVTDGRGKLLWEHEWPGGNKYERALIVDDYVIMAEQAKSFNVYDLATGKELFADAGGTRILGDYVKPVASNGRLYAFGGVRDLDVAKGCPSRASTVAVTAKAFDPSPVRYMWPVIVDGRLIAHCSTRLACWDLRVPATTK